MLPSTNHSVEVDSVFDTQEEVTSSKARTHSPRSYAIGIGLILVVASLWSLSSFVTQDLYRSGYNKPFLVTYTNISTHSLYLIPFFLRHWWNRSRRERVIHEYHPLADLDSVSEHSDEMSNPTLNNKSSLSLTEDPLSPLTRKQTARLAFVFCGVVFISSWSSNASLELTSVASATILSSISGFFTLVIGRMFGVETLGLVKIGAVITSFAGVVFVSLSDFTLQPPTTNIQPRLYLDDIKSHATLGNILALISALFGAMCTILLKVRMKEESRVDMQLFFGLVGLFNILLFWPVGLILHLMGAEIFELPHTKQALYAIITNMAITISSDYLWTLAMLKTTPLVVTVGLSMTIPIAVVVDFLRNTPIRGTVLAGAMLVIMSFVAIGLDNSNDRARSLRKVQERPW